MGFFYQKNGYMMDYSTHGSNEMVILARNCIASFRPVDGKRPYTTSTLLSSDGITVAVEFCSHLLRKGEEKTRGQKFIVKNKGKFLTEKIFHFFGLFIYFSTVLPVLFS